MSSHADRIQRRLGVTMAHLRPDAASFGPSLEMSDACGIIAFVGKEPASPYLMEGLTILQNRGYDSAGIATIDPSGHLVVSKHASVGSTSDALKILAQDLPTHGANHIGIAHTRWATHGPKTDVNAHPHLDAKQRVALVHNGVIENSAALRTMLKEKHGIECVSETDTETIVQLIGLYLDEGLELLDAIKKTQTMLHGTWGLAIIHRDHPNQIIAARNGSPLLVGVSENRMFVASEATAFARYTKDFIALENDEVVVVNLEGQHLNVSRVEKAQVDVLELDPSPFEHWTAKEIFEQPQSLSRALNYGGRILDEHRVKLGGLESRMDELMAIRNLVIVGCGTSLFAGLHGAKIMRMLHCFDTVTAIDASEFTHDSLPMNGGGILAISQSGETKDVERVIRIAQSEGVPCFSVVNSVGTLIARLTRCGVYLNAGRETAVASTKAFTSQTLVLALVGIWFAQNRSTTSHSAPTRESLVASLQRVPMLSGVALQLHGRMKELATRLVDKDKMFVLGKGLGEPIAYEAALKIKEITYIHAEGYAGGALKHGPFALIDEGTPIILYVLDDEFSGLMLTAVAEVKARGAYTIVITDNPDIVPKTAAHEVVRIPHAGLLTSVVGIVPIQLLAYEISVARGNNPDRPRHLAKTVTTD